MLVGWPDEEAETNHLEIGVPGLGSCVNVGKTPDEALPGLDAFAPEDRPPVWITFWAFRIMVGHGR